MTQPGPQGPNAMTTRRVSMTTPATLLGGLGTIYDPVCLRDPARASGPGCQNHSKSLIDPNQDFRVRELSRIHTQRLSRGSQGPISSGDWCDENICWVPRHLEYQELEISSLTLEMLLRNLPRLGGYTQRSTTTTDILNEHRRTSFSTTRFNSALQCSGA